MNEGKIGIYLRLVRFNHWIKNLVVPLGSLIALAPAGLPAVALSLNVMALSFLAAGLVSSANYVVNDLIDSPYDAKHPTKKNRPIPSGRISKNEAVALAAVLFVTGFVLIPLPLGATVWLLALFLSGLVYNIRPMRAKDVPYLDVMVESINNPIRFMIGWYAVTAGVAQAVILAGLWLYSCVLMTGKRLAELRALGHEKASRYRVVFGVYTEGRLSAVMVTYIVLTVAAFVYTAAKFMPAAVWLAIPLAVQLAWYYKLTLKKDSFAQRPERVNHEPLFLAYSAVFVLVFLWTVLRR